MRARASMRWWLVGLAVAGCGQIPEEELNAADAGEVTVVEEGKADAALSLTLRSGSSTRFSFRSTGRKTSVTVDCGVSSSPDTVGTVFAVTAPSLGIARSTSLPARDGNFRWVGALAAGTHTVTLSARRSGTCRATVTTISSTTSCASRMEWHSPNTGHTHIRVGTSASDWESFPTSGNHWGAWAAWGREYSRPVMRGFLLHGLEHGGIVLSYKCRSASESSACRSARDQLVGLQRSFGWRRVIVTPDPTQPAMFGVRMWRWGYLADCFDSASANAFMRAHYRRGREDIDADPPYSYDPTTTNVPCENLMAAPDGC